MLANVIRGLIPSIVFVGAAALAFLVINWAGRKPKERRSPLTRQLLRGPGQTLMSEAEDISTDLVACLVTFTILPLLFYATFITTRYLAEPGPRDVSPYIYAVALTGMEVYFALRVGRLLKLRRTKRLGIDCEIAVGQELNGLMLDGYRVYHDVPAAGFNIDHVVVGSNGVFAVETKGRSKPDRKRGKDDATVVYDGDALRFPHFTEKEPLMQAKRQAAWLSSWLTSAMAEPVFVMPVLALPGWFIERKKWGDVLLLNGKDYRFIVTQRTGVVLSQSLVERIAARLEEVCRDVTPKAYPRADKRVA
jgi:hypothetical protein